MKKSLDDDLIKKFDDQNSFIKVTTPAQVQGSEKAALNRKGNQLFNEGNIEAAKRVFITTGYSDGLSRVGSHYKTKGRSLEALKMYWMAHDKKQSEPLIEQLAGIIQGMISEEDDE
ncbi:MAG: hypothetical protein LBU66_01730 [Treponema sp.]|jgi:hypothetical protein|nr:hypothetical protein [Treponema sp.]